MRYMRFDKLTNKFTNLIRNGKAEIFRKRYPDVDMLSFGDVHS
ncbi:hypothetical protein [Streptomyces sp. NBC_01637]|nr:hypothetical protein OH719_32220 [Streptomyces sp. NBC_01653]WTD88749.1 hypothetical protein OG891_14650 [Streptomyces sp. NBC_01637]